MIRPSLSLAAVALFTAVYHARPLLSTSSPVDESINLRPINIRSYESAMGLHRREEAKFSELDPQTQARLIWGRPGLDGPPLMADTTLYAPSGMPIVLLEHFESLTSAIDCKGDDGTISLTFASKEAYDYALNVWSRINEKDSEQLLVIANHDGCGPNKERQAYKWVSMR